MVQTQKKLSTQPVSAATCRAGLQGLPELEQIVTESRGIVCAAVHSSGFFTARIAVQAVLLVCMLSLTSGTVWFAPWAGLLAEQQLCRS